MSATPLGDKKHSKLRPLWISLKILATLLCMLIACALGAIGYMLHTTGIGGALWAMSKEQALVWHYYVDPLPPKELRQKALAGFAAQLDAHSEYMPPAEERAFMEQINGSFGGIGVAFGVRKGQAVALLVYPDSPAQRAGVKVGDALISADGQSIEASKLADELRKVRGPIGSSVSLSLLRDGKPVNLSVKREQIDVPSVASTTIPAEKSPTGKPVAVLQLREFTSRTPDEMGEALTKLFSGDKKPAGLIIDERRNPGGVLTSSVAAAAFFLPTSATVVSSLGRPASDPRGDDANTAFWKAQALDYWTGPPETDPVQRARADIPQLKDIPIAVLIDSSSASAAEIFAGALKDNHRAVIVGQNSFGKGSVQQIYPLGEDGAIKFTVSRYYTPSGKSIQALGVSPDALAGTDHSSLRESDLPRHLPAPKVDANGLPVATARETSPEADQIAEAQLLLKARRARANQVADMLDAKSGKTGSADKAASQDDDAAAPPPNPFDVNERAKPDDEFMKAALAQLAAGKGLPGPLATPPGLEKAQASAPPVAASDAKKAAAIEMSLVAPRI